MNKKKIKLIHLICFLLVFTIGFGLPEMVQGIDDENESDATSQEEWTMFQNDPSHLGFTNNTAPSTSKIRWKAYIGRKMTSAVVKAGRVFIGGDSTLYCLDASDGSFLWKFGPNAVVFCPVVDEQSVYVAYRKTISCLDVVNGLIKWQYSINESATSPLLFEGKIYVGSEAEGLEDNFIYCLDAQSGALLWKYRSDWSINACPGGKHGRIYFGSYIHPRGSVSCLNATTGSLLWDYHDFPNSQSPADSPIVIGNKHIYIGTVPVALPGDQIGYVYCLNSSNGSFLWRRKLPGAIYASPALAYERLFVGCGSNEKSLFCLNVSEGSILWKWGRKGGGVLSSPALAKEKVYVGAGAWVCCFNMTNGALHWFYDTQYYVDRCSPAIAYGVLYIGSGDAREGGGGAMYCFGSPEQFIPHPNQVPHPKQDNKWISWILLGLGIAMTIGVFIFLMFYIKRKRK